MICELRCTNKTRIQEKRKGVPTCRRKTCTVQLRLVQNFKIQLSFFGVTGMISPVRMLCCKRSTGPTGSSVLQHIIHQQRASPQPQNITGLKTETPASHQSSPMLNLPTYITLQSKHASTILFPTEPVAEASRITSSRPGGRLEPPALQLHLSLSLFFFSELQVCSCISFAHVSHQESGGIPGKQLTRLVDSKLSESNTLPMYHLSR
jgi:hypothetical protein